MRTVLYCGGSLDGQWKEVHPDIREQRVVKPLGPIDWKASVKAEVGEIEYELYRIWPISVLGYQMHVAALQGSADEGRAVLKTLVRRDVFANFTKPPTVYRESTRRTAPRYQPDPGTPRKST